MKVKYKIIKTDRKQKYFMDKYKVCACTYCDYAEGFNCTFRGKKCPASETEFIKKVYR